MCGGRWDARNRRGDEVTGGSVGGRLGAVTGGVVCGGAAGAVRAIEGLVTATGFDGIGLLGAVTDGGVDGLGV